MCQVSSVDLITKAGQSKVDGASGVGFEYALQQALSFGLASPKFGAARAAMTWAGYLKIPNSRARGFFSGCLPTFCFFQTSKDITNVLENSENYFSFLETTPTLCKYLGVPVITSNVRDI